MAEPDTATGILALESQQNVERTARSAANSPPDTPDQADVALFAGRNDPYPTSADTLTGFIGPARHPSFLPSIDRVALPALTRLPLVPTDILKHHHCFIATDTRFRSAARLLQSLHRTDAGLPIGVHVTGYDAIPTRTKLGSRLRADVARAGVNFISPAVHTLVRRELVMREDGAAIDEDRLFANLLSSMPLCFNLFGPMALDLDLATTTWRRLLPDFVHTVRDIAFEHSPGRGDPRFLADGTAFDLRLNIITPDGEPASVFVEVKYSEGMSGPAARPRPRYDDASRQVRLFHDPDAAPLRSVALEQLWREHMLGQLAVDLGIVNKARFVAIGPRLNRRVAAAFKLFDAQLADIEADNDLRVGFTPLSLEAVLEAMAEAGAVDLARQLWARYLDFDRVLALALAPITPPTPRSRSTSAASLRKLINSKPSTAAPMPASEPALQAIRSDSDNPSDTLTRRQPSRHNRQRPVRPRPARVRRSGL